MGLAAHGKEADNAIRYGNTGVRKALPMLVKVREVAFTPANIASSFEICWIVTLNPDVVLGSLKLRTE